MAKGLVVRSEEGAVTRPGNIAVGEGAATEGLTFSTPAEMYSDLPTDFRRGAASSTALALRREAQERQGSTSTALARPEDLRAPMNLPPKVAATTIASGVRKLSRSFKVGDRIVQRKLGWLATPTYIFITTVERELQWREDGKLKPSGAWHIEHRRRYAPKSGVAEKRVGTVAEPLASDASASSSSHYVEEAEQIPDAFVAGAEAMAYLPLAVRGDIVKQVPNPTYFDGRLLGLCAPSGGVSHYEVTVLRMNDDVALVISATKPVAGGTWEVTQAKYELGTPEVEAAS